MPYFIAITMCLDKTGLINDGVEYNYVRREYGEAIKKAGGQPFYVDASADPLEVAKLCSGVVISGGQDIDPTLYGEANRGCNILEPTERTLWERRLIEACDAEKVPILGICYGSQLLNIHYGGTLYQDIASEVEDSLDHGIPSAAAMHNITFVEDILGYKRGYATPVAARHHQAVRELAPGFSAAAYADDGTIEAIQGRGHFGIQWHPESDVTAQIIYSTFMSECKRRARAMEVPGSVRVLEGSAA